MTNTQAQQVLGTMLMRYDLTDAELEAIGMAGEALEDEWISVEDRLPKFDTVVLIYAPFDTDGPMYTAVLDSENGEWYDSVNFVQSDGSVTYWRYLPDAPGKEEEHETEEQ